MKFFERNRKYNWVDENDLFVGFDSGTCCCELAHYLYLNKNPVMYPKALNALYDYVSGYIDGFNHEDSGIEKIPEDFLDLENYKFDPDSTWEGEMAQKYNNTNFVVFKLLPDSPQNDAIYLMIYNIHNGYYGHGFEFKNGDNIILDGIL